MVRHPASCPRTSQDWMPSEALAKKGWQVSVGELFILGFFGKTLPAWLKEFAARFGLGGVILFDYSCQTKQYDNNIDSPAQVKRLCDEIAGLPSRPLVFIDQEGG